MVVREWDRRIGGREEQGFHGDQFKKRKPLHIIRATTLSLVTIFSCASSVIQHLTRGGSSHIKCIFK